VAPALMRLAWESVAALAIAPLQDLLNLGTEARMNVPGRANGNWRWRCTEEMLATRAFDWLQDLTKMSGRSNASRWTTTERNDSPGPSPCDRRT
jgi:4-alpha-glucanotransferase